VSSEIETSRKTLKVTEKVRTTIDTMVLSTSTADELGIANGIRESDGGFDGKDWPRKGC
jgi:hypothetical protein